MKSKITINKYLKLFIGGVLLYLIAVLPFIIYHGGVFFYYGDYNVQQVPFYIFVNRAVKEGRLFWNPYIDLGSSTFGSFAFYLFGSPFFWLSAVFPEKWIPYMLPFFMSLKYGTALATSFLYMEKHLHSDKAAFAGSLLYTFSGFAAVNIVFQHFHEAVCFYPLYLYVFEQYVENKNRRNGLRFALMTAFMSVLNYFFFFEQAVFFVLYYCVCYAVSEKRSIKRIVSDVACLLLYGILGLCLSSFFLINVIDTVTGNSRLSDFLLGYDMLAYEDPVTPLAIIKSMFMNPDIIGRGTLFSNDQIKNSMPALYLPMFAVSGVFAYFASRRSRKDRYRTLLAVCAVIAFIPVLNSIFAMFNDEYYSRWFFMPLLFMALVTAKVLEENDMQGLRKGSLICTGAFILLFLSSLLPSADEDGNTVYLQLVKYRRLFNIESLVTLLMYLALLFILYIHPMICGIKRRRLCAAAGSEAGTDRNLVISKNSDIKGSKASNKKVGFRKNKGSGKGRWISSFFKSLSQERKKNGGPGIFAVPDGFRLLNRFTIVITIICCLGSTMGLLLCGNTLIAKSGQVKWKQQLLDNVPLLPSSSQDGQFYRVDTDGTSTNYEMVWGFSTIHCFESTVSPGVFNFYNGLGISRTVDSKPGLTRYGLRAILSERYYLENHLVKTEKNYTKQGGLPGYEKAGDSNGYNIYENRHFIPIGFTFDSFMTTDNYSKISSKNEADRSLVRNIILSEEDAQKYRHLFDNEDTNTAPGVPSDEEFLEECDKRASTAALSFEFTDSGFISTVDLPSEELVFYSVPYEDGFSAFVDGKETQIIIADCGLMAFDIPAGSHDIEVTYTPSHLKEACILSLAALGVLIYLYYAYLRKIRK